MFIMRLCEYAERTEIPPVGYSERPIKWVIRLARGARSEIVPLGNGKQGVSFTVPDTGNRTSNVEAVLLVDTAEYALGRSKDKSRKTEKTPHVEFKQLLEACYKETKEPSIKVILDFLNGDGLNNLSYPKDFKAADTIFFSVEGQYPHELESVKTFWAKHYWDNILKEVKKEGKCMVCGEMARPVPRHPYKFKRLDGVGPKGAPIVSANGEFAVSYGFQESLIAPMCYMCVEKYTKAIHKLFDGDNTHLEARGVDFLFWTRQGEFPMKSFLSDVDHSKVEALLEGKEPSLDVGKVETESDSGKVRALMESPWKGREFTALNSSDFYCLSLSANPGRVIIRDWSETTVANVEGYIRNWFGSQRLAPINGNKHRYFSIGDLADSVVAAAAQKKLDAGKSVMDLVARTSEGLVRNALFGDSLPQWLLPKVLERVRAEISRKSADNEKNKGEYGLTYQRAVLIKMALASNKKEVSMSLNPEHPEPAYHCGRLFAELERLQALAMGKTNTTVTDRFFGRASVAPNVVFGLLMQNSVHHLAKVRKKNRYQADNIIECLEKIQDRINDNYPSTLDMNEQGLFVLGYYHQKAHHASTIVQNKTKKDENAA